jgi:hypothetical protein
MSRLDAARATTAASKITRKIFVTLAIGGAALTITNLTEQPPVWGLTLSCFIGGVTLVVQFLIDFENRLKAVEDNQLDHSKRMEKLVEEEFCKINEATELFGLVEASAVRTDVVTQLVRNSTQIDPQCPSLVYRFAQREIGQMSDFLRELSNDNVTYDGEDRDWMLGLGQLVESTISATSLTTVDAGGKGFVDGGLWTSDLGQRYLEVQRDAVKRGVAVRRVFIMDRPDLANDSALLEICQGQQKIGIQVRVLDASAIPGTRKSSLFDFILFDDVISYEVTPASRIGDGMNPSIVTTRLVLSPKRVKERIQRFDDLWLSANELE